MLTRYLNLYMVIIGIILNGLILWRIEEILKYFPYKFPQLDKLFCVNIVYMLAVGMEVIHTGRPGYSVFIMMNVVNILQYLCWFILSAFIVFYFGYHLKKSGLLPIDMRPFLYLYSLYIIIPLLGFILQLMLNESGGNYLLASDLICCLLVIAEGYYIWSRQYIRKRSQLEQMKVSMKFGRMHPDFVYNILADISQLCKQNPFEASEIIDIFADFLRKCMNDISEAKLNPFAEEFDHMENYLTLEKIRFGDDLQVNYDIEEEDFYIPSQVLQRTAECMIHYVMSQSEDVFSLMVRTSERNKGYLVEVYNENHVATGKEREQSEEELMEIEDIRTRLNVIPEAYLEYINNQELGTVFRIYL